MENEIREVVKSFMNHWNRHEPKAMASLWAEDGDLITPWGLWGKGRAAVEEAFIKEQTGPMRKSSLIQEIHHFHPIDANAAWAEGSAHIKGALGPDGKEMPIFDHHVVYLFVRKNGKWEVRSARAFKLLGPLTIVH